MNTTVKDLLVLKIEALNRVVDAYEMPTNAKVDLLRHIAALEAVVDRLGERDVINTH